ncbi:MAG: hypothetical protein JKY20_08110 [Alphaproteobacteria bacterium]|nr:hypothetical protein [Alphaproteobacteria bacterium]
MGGFETVIAGAVINAVLDAKSAKQQNKAVAQQQAVDQQQLALARNVEARNRTDKLRSDQASQRARFGALGVSATDGSASAVLRGLSSTAARDIGDLTQARDLQSLSIAQNGATQRRRNLLELRRKQFSSLRTIAGQFS